MSDSQFIEALSSDPIVRDIHRRAMRVLNDPMLDRNQRVFHIRKLQQILVEHQSKQAAKANLKPLARPTLSKKVR